jgi:hypothetical protein
MQRSAPPTEPQEIKVGDRGNTCKVSEALSAGIQSVPWMALDMVGLEVAVR